MTFVQSFYSFNLDITNSDSGVYAKARAKIPRHPDEMLEHLYARVIAYAHSFDTKIEFTAGIFDRKLPSLQKKDLLGEVSLAIEIGEIDPEKIHKALRRKPHPHYRIYFYDEAQIAKFCHEMRGSTTNWIVDTEFFAIPFDFLTSITQFEKSSSSWVFTFVDNTLYLSVDDNALSTELAPLDMWAKFQESLAMQTRKEDDDK